MTRQKFEEKAFDIYKDSVIYKVYDLFDDIKPDKVILGKIISIYIRNTIINVIIDDIPGDKYTLQRFTINKAKENIRVINIFKYELIDKTKYFILKDIVSRALNIHNKNIIYARNTIIKEIKSDEVKDFLNKYHLQGWTKSSINIGLFYNNELVSVMTFGKPRINHSVQYELIRLASKCDIVGGTQKMFNYFVKQYKPESILSYCDITKFKGNVYLKLGFKTSQECITTPNYVWFNKDTCDVLPRYKTMKQKLVKAGLGSEYQTEDEIMTNLGYYKIYNCGNLKFSWYNTKA